MQRSRLTKTTTTVLALVMALLAVTSCDWSQFRGAAGHGGHTLDGAIKPAAVPGLVQKWIGPTGAAVQSSPIVVANVAYVGSNDGNLYAFDATTGEVKWTHPIGAAVASTPVIVYGVVFVGADDHKVHAIRLSDRTQLWEATLDSGFAGTSSALMFANGMLYASSTTSLYALDLKGAVKFSVPVTATGPLSPPTAADNLVYVSSHAEGSVWAFRADTGLPAWSYTDPGARAICPSTTPSPTASSGTLYVTLCPSDAPGAPSLFAFQSATGAPLWSTAANALTSPVTVGFGPLYAVSSVTQSLEARSPTDGSVLWTAALGSTSTSTPSLGDALLYVGTDDGRLRAFSADGSVSCSGTPKTCTALWTAQTGGPVTSSPAVSNGFVYVGSDDHELHAYTLPASGFGKSTLVGTNSVKPTASRFGPDGRLYVADLSGTIRAYTVTRDAANSYRVTATETINLVRQIPNHDDDGALAPDIATRMMTGLLVTGTASNPIIYATSSDPRIGVGTSGGRLNPDTNSGTVSLLTRSGGVWSKVDLVRGLPRSFENHGTNTIVLDAATNTLYVAQGGNTNMGAPSTNFAFLPEYAYSGAVLKVDLAAVGNTTYDLPTLVDEDLPSLVGPFGGDFGKHQAKLTLSSPVQVYSPGYRNPFSLVKTRLGKLYVIDNGPNGGWGAAPVGAGPGGTCTNEVSEPGTDDRDSLHLIPGPGYYGGHANPTRGNVANTFNTTDPQSPVPAANPVECISRDSTTNGSIATFNSGTTGMAEYTASNFDGQLSGDLIVGSYYGSVFRAHLDPAGNVVRTDVLFSNVGAHPLDVAVQGDAGAMPGTIWVPDYTTGTVIVFEPNDYGGVVVPPCTGENSTALDEDNDSYSNSDELDNHTDPCSAADLPHDWNHNGVSDLNDPDDDSDGQPDTSDPFALDPNNGRTTSVPIGYSWLNGSPMNPCAPTLFPTGCPGGLLGLGFTGLMTNGVTNYAALFSEGNMTIGGAAGVLTVSMAAAGTALGAANDQQYAFQFGVNANPAVASTFTLHTRVQAPFSGITPTGNQSIGMFFGTGNQDNYVELSLTADNGTPGLRFMKEVTGEATIEPTVPLTLPGPESIDLYLTVDPASNTAVASFRVTENGVTGPLTPLGTTMPFPAAWLTNATRGLALGVTATSSGGPTFPATWSVLEALGGPAS